MENQQAQVIIKAWIDQEGNVNMQMDIDKFTIKQMATLGVMLEHQIVDMICASLKMPKHITEILTEKNISYGSN